MSHLNFDPWIGRNYENRSSKLLLIGDSHYWPYAPEPIHYERDFTQNRVGDNKSIQAEFFKNVAKLFERDDFSQVRDNIAFGNAIQDFLKSSSTKPTKKQLDDTEYSLKEYITLTKPDKVIVLSFRVWEHLFNRCKTWGEYQGNLYAASKIKVTLWKLYPTENHECLATGFYHPSYRGWKLEEWKPLLKKFLSL